MCPSLVPTGNIECSSLSGSVHGPGFLSNCEALRSDGGSMASAEGWTVGPVYSSSLPTLPLETQVTEGA